MNNKEFENKYEGTARKLRVIGLLLLISGLVCVVIGMGDFFISAANWGMPTLFFLNFIGFPLIAVGASCLLAGSRRKIADYSASQVAPVAKDMTNYMVDGTSESVARATAKVMAEVNKTGKGVVEGIDANTCCKCGTANPIGAKFCSKCGNPLTKKCPYCGAENDDGAKYCNTCGRQL